jgi:hypothetical protein
MAQHRENSLDEHQEELTLDPFLKSKKAKLEPSLFSLGVHRGAPVSIGAY